jgi:hypothetical protein
VAQRMPEGGLQRCRDEALESDLVARRPLGTGANYHRKSNHHHFFQTHHFFPTKLDGSLYTVSLPAGRQAMKTKVNQKSTGFGSRSVFCATAQQRVQPRLASSNGVEDAADQAASQL